MTSKEKLKALKEQLILHPSYLNIIEEIEKDLEVLEILQPRIRLIHTKVKNDNKEYNVEYITATGFVFENSKEYKLLKEWLEENDK